MRTAIAICLCLAATSANAEFTTANELLAKMNGSSVEKISAQGYVTGVADAIAGVFWCPVDAVTIQQVYDITKKALVDMPEYRNHSASAYVRASLNNSFPCTDEKAAE